MQLALQGRMTDHHRWTLRVLWDQLEFLAAQLAKLDGQSQEQVGEYQEALTLCTTIPGIEEVAAANLIAEIGTHMDQFPSAQQLASWAGLCPVAHESAGKRLSGKPHQGRAWLQRSLCQAAWAASQGYLTGDPVSPLSRAQRKGACHCGGRP
jgi:transposase